VTARTAAIRRALAQAGDKGLVHAASQQNTGTWLAMCGRQVRGRDIRTWEGEHAVQLGETQPDAFCPDCIDILELIGTAVRA
jgi:hypothetical protein